MVATKKKPQLKAGWFTYRDAVTGEFVSMWYALLNKATTVREWITRKIAPKKCE